MGPGHLFGRLVLEPSSSGRVPAAPQAALAPSTIQPLEKSQALLSTRPGVLRLGHNPQIITRVGAELGRAQSPPSNQPLSWDVEGSPWCSAQLRARPCPYRTTQHLMRLQNQPSEERGQFLQGKYKCIYN